MVWKYEDPSHSPKDAVRLLIGDTDTREQLLQDGEIQYFLNLYNQAALNAAIRCCEAIEAKFGRFVDEKVGQVSLAFSQRIKGYGKVKTELMARLAIEDGAPVVPSLSVSQKQANRENTDNVKPAFTRNMMVDEQNSALIPPGGPVSSPSGTDAGE